MIDRGEGRYEDWTRWCEELRYDRDAIDQMRAGLTSWPRISLVMPVFNAEPRELATTIASVRAQFYADWELYLCDASSQQQVRQLLEAVAATDDRLTVVPAQTIGDTAAALNPAIDLATGEFVGFIDCGSDLTADALLAVANVLQEMEADFIYSDEDERNDQGTRHHPFFKPAWSPDLLLSCLYTGHLSVYRREIVDAIGRFRLGLDGGHEHDLALRFAEHTSRIVHIPKVLYHGRRPEETADSNARDSPHARGAARAIVDALRRRGVVGEMCPQPTAPDTYRIRRSIEESDKVSIVIPTRDGVLLLARCIDSIASHAEYPNVEIIIVDNGSTDEATTEYLDQSPHRVIRHGGPFNFSQLNNVAARHADGAYLLFLNDDTEVLVDAWLTEMVAHAQRPDVGAVGAKLLYPDGSVQHGGVVLGLGGVAGHLQSFPTGNGTLLDKVLNTERESSAVTAACMMIRRDLFLALGGFDERNLPVSLNDVDLCLRLRRQGYRIIYTPYALLRHHESASRRAGNDARETAYMWRTWGPLLNDDPFYHPCLSRTHSWALDLSKPDSYACIYSQVVASETVGVLSRVGKVGQEFYAVDANLSAVAICLATYQKTYRGVLRFHLRRSPSADEDVRTVDIDGATIGDNTYHTFFFAPLSDSAGRRYYFYIEAVTTWGRGKITIWKSDVTDGVAGPYFVNHQPRSGTLSFRVYCRSDRFRSMEMETGPIARRSE